jgi:hypothetical protein
MQLLSKEQTIFTASGWVACSLRASGGRFQQEVEIKGEAGANRVLNFGWFFIGICGKNINTLGGAFSAKIAGDSLLLHVNIAVLKVISESGRRRRFNAAHRVSSIHIKGYL